MITKKVQMTKQKEKLSSIDIILKTDAINNLIMLSKQQYKNFLLKQIKQKQQRKKNQKLQQLTPRNINNIRFRINKHPSQNELPMINKNGEPSKIHNVIGNQYQNRGHEQLTGNKLVKLQMNKQVRTKTENNKLQSQIFDKKSPLKAITQLDHQQQNTKLDIKNNIEQKNQNGIHNLKREIPQIPRRNLLILENIAQQQLKLNRKKQQIQQAYLKQQIQRKLQDKLSKKKYNNDIQTDTKIQKVNAQISINNKNHLNQAVVVSRLSPDVPNQIQKKEKKNFEHKNRKIKKKQIREQSQNDYHESKNSEIKQVKKMINKMKEEMSIKNLLFLNELQKAKLEARQANLEKQKFQFELYKIKEQLKSKLSQEKVVSKNLKKEKNIQRLKNQDYYAQPKQIVPLRFQSNQNLSVKKYKIQDLQQGMQTLVAQTKKIPLVIKSKNNDQLTMTKIQQYAIDENKNRADKNNKEQDYENIQSHYLKNEFLDSMNNQNKIHKFLIKPEVEVMELNIGSINKQYEDLIENKNLNRKVSKLDKIKLKPLQFNPYQKLSQEQRKYIISSAQSRNRNRFFFQNQIDQQLNN